MYKKIIFACVMLFSVIFAENNENSNAFNKYMSPEGGINPMSGTVALQRDLTTLSVGQLKVNFSLKYSGNVYQEARKSNDEVQSGIVGLGWSLGRSRIVCDCKGNTYLDDDTYYLVSADGNRYKIFEENAWRQQFDIGYDSNAQEKWWVEGNPYWKVERFSDSTQLPNENGHVWRYVKGWKITDSEGIVHTYGDISETKSLTAPKPNATEYDLAWLQYTDDEGMIHPAYGIMEDTYGGSPSYYPVAWNISKEESLDGNTLEYDYEQISEKLSGSFATGMKINLVEAGYTLAFGLTSMFDFVEKKQKWDSQIGYTKETYLKSVRASNNARLVFTYKEKGVDDFYGEYIDNRGFDENIADPGSDMFREKINRKYLSKIEVYGPSEKTEGDTLGMITFCYSAMNKEKYVKRLLSAVHFYDKNGTLVDFEEYSYYTDDNQAQISNTESAPYPLGLLYKVKGKDCGWVEYTYSYEPMGNGHVEELALDSIYGRGFLEDGTSYIVGRKNNELKLYTKILGRWVTTDLKIESNGDMVAVPAADSVALGDAGWFLTINGGNCGGGHCKARIFLWNGKSWQMAKEWDFHSTKLNPTHFSDIQKRGVVAGPDYVIEYVYVPRPGFLCWDFVWTKWNKIPDGFVEFSLANTISNLVIKPQKNHILVQYLDGGRSAGNELVYKVFSFRDGSFYETATNDNEIDSDNKIYLNGSFLADVGEENSWWKDSRVLIKNWNGHRWVRQIRYEFSNSDPANVESYGSDYFAVRYNDKRHLRVFALEDEMWNGDALHNKFFNYRLFENNYWYGAGSEDFFAATGTKNNFEIFFHKNGERWKSLGVGNISGFEKKEKALVVGKDWVVERKASKKAFIWNGERWIEEDLSAKEFLGIPPRNVVGKGAVYPSIYSLGNNALAISSNGMTRIIYKVNNSFVNEFGTYRVRYKEIYEPVTENVIKYGYSFYPGENAKKGIAFDESTNTPLMDVMKVEMPDGKGLVERQLCDLGDGVESAAVGSVCSESQVALDGNSKISQTKIHFNRERSDWPFPVYLDQEDWKVEIARGIKTVTRSEYSKNNGMPSKITKKVGKKSTEQKYVYVADLRPTSENERKIADSLRSENRVNVLAGAYSCIPNCSTGTIVQASANGLSLVDGIETVTSTWKFKPDTNISEAILNNHIRNISLKSTGNVNWERQSLNSRYVNKHVVETYEGPKNIKTASFYENTKWGKMLGGAVDCGIDEGLMLSGETCNIANWEGCVNDSLEGSAKDAVDLGRTDYKNFGRFSKRFVKLTSGKPLVGTILHARNAEYKFSAWMQYGLANGTLSLSINGKTEKIWEIRPSNLPIDSIGKWKQIEWSGKLNGITSIALNVQNVSSRLPLQDIRILPSTATSTASFWNHEWNKVETTVGSKGIGSYIGFDHIGRETKHYSETVDGDVYLSSKTSYMDGKCTAFPNGSDQLSSLSLNGITQKIPNADDNRTATYTLSRNHVYIDFQTVDAWDGVKYKLYPQSDTPPNNWNVSSCDSLCKPSFSFTSEKKTWILKIDVTPYSEEGYNSEDVYTFVLKKKENNWVEYGTFEDFSHGSNPKFVDDRDSSFVVYRNREGKMNFSEYTGNRWSEKKEQITDYITEFDVFSSNGHSFVTYVPDDVLGVLTYPKVFEITKNSVVERDVLDKALMAEDVKMANDTLGKPILLFNRTNQIIEKDNTENHSAGDSINTRYEYVYDGTLSVMGWNAEEARFEYLGNMPVFEHNRAYVDKNTKLITYDTGEITSYKQGVINDKESISFDAVVGPEGKLYVAYVSTSNYFDWCQSNVDEDGCYLNEPLVYVKRLYDASETSASSADIWAGVSQQNGVPLYQGDVLSWNNDFFGAVKGVKKIKLAYDGSDLYMAVLYPLPENDSGYSDESSSSSSQSTLSSSSRGSLLKSSLALSVFKGTILNNTSINGVFYSKYLKWEALKDNSVKKAFMAGSISDEQSRIAYLNDDDDFDFTVRNGFGPYVLFRNKDNKNAISVISFKNGRWLSVGEPAFAYPQITDGSADLGVNIHGNPFVVFKASNSRNNNGFAKKIISMHYNEKNAVDLTLDKFETSDADFNAVCSFRQYILHYVANLGEVDNFIFKATPKTPNHVREIQILSNGKYLKRYTNFADAISIPLVKGLNKLEIRLVGIDESSLSYEFDLYRKYDLNPNFYTVGLTANTTTTFIPDSGMVVDVFPTSSTEDGNVVLDVHFETGWVLILNDDEYKVASPIEFSMDNLPMNGVFIHVIDSTRIPIVFENGLLPIDDPSVFSWYPSSSSSSIGDEPSSSGSSSSSTSVINEDMSTNVPIEIRNLTSAHLFAVEGMAIADNVSVRGHVFSDGDFEIGVSSSVYGDVYSRNNVVLRNHSVVGNVYYGNNFESLDGARYESKTHWVPQNNQLIPTYTFASGELNILVNECSTQNIFSGSYKDFTARTGAVVEFAAGDYYFKNFYTDSRVTLNFSPGTRIWISGDMRIGNGNKMLHAGNTGDLFIYAGGNVSIETNVEMSAVLVAPRSIVSISTGTHVRGYVIGKRVNVQPNVIVE